MMENRQITIRLFPRAFSGVMVGILCLLSVFAFATAAYGQTNQMTNGSFESDAMPASPGYTSVFSGWTATGGTIRNSNALQAFYHTASNGAVPNGVQVAGSQGAGSLSQTLSGLTNSMYCTPSFYLCKRADAGSNGDITLTVKIGSQTIYGPTVVNWTTFTLINISPFYYNSSWGIVLSFTASSPVGDATVLLDNVVFNTVPSYTITPSVTGGNGTISPGTAQTIYSGGSVSFTIAPNSGYRIYDVTVDSARLATPVTSYTFNNVMANHTIAASFALPDWTFDTAGYSEAWAATGQIASSSIASSLLSYDITSGAGDPMFDNAVLSLPRASYNWLMVKVRNQTTANAGRMYWNFEIGRAHV